MKNYELYSPEGKGIAAIRLEGFSPAEEAMLCRALAALRLASYDVTNFKVLIRADLPQGYRGMTLADGAALGAEAFPSQAMLNHVLEEEFRHLQQRANDQITEFGPDTARRLEDDADEGRKFPFPTG